MASCPVSLALAAWLGVLMLCTGFGPPVLTDGGHPPLRLGPDQVAGLVRQSRPPAVSAASVLLFELDAQQTLYARQAEVPRPPASTTKVMTALLVLRQADLQDRVVISKSAATTGGSRMGLSPGEIVSVHDLLYGLLLPSGNDAAVALAEHVAGDEAAFVAMMNREAQDLGLTATRFSDPHGLDDEFNRASASDLLLLVRAALGYPLFAQVVSTQAATVAGRRLTNTNQLLGVHSGADGVKTGTTDEAGECLIASVSRDGHRLVLVLLGSQDRYGDARALLDYARLGWRWGPTALPNDALAWELGQEGRPVRLRTIEVFDVFLPAWQWPLLQAVRQVDTAVSLASPQRVGVLQWFLGGDVVAAVPLDAVQRP